MKEGYLLYRNAPIFTYASSIASTWVWAPALFVSSENAYFHGLLGFLLFWVPNVLTLIVFGKVSEYIRKQKDGMTVSDAIDRASDRQKRLHLSITTLVLICSTAVQLLGFYVLFHDYINLSKFQISLLVSILALATVGYGGLKHSIITDEIKWFIMIVFGTILLYTAYDKTHYFSIVGFNSPEKDANLIYIFGIPTIIGLMAAPYADQTFWQRVFSMDSKIVKKSFYLSAILFGLVPLIFGMIGFTQRRISGLWTIGYAFFYEGYAMYLLMICTIAALLSTLDSNLCAIASIVIHDFKKSLRSGVKAMVGILIMGMLIVCNFNITIVDLFLIYGTIRTCAAIPTVLIIINKYNEKRLFYSTLAAMIIASIGYILAPANYKFIFTALGLLIPLAGYSKENSNETICTTP